MLNRLFINSRTLTVITLGLLISAISFAASGQWLCGDLLLEKAQTLSRPKQDSAIELELGLNQTVMGLLTTTNGKVSGLYGDLKIPTWFIRWAEENRPRVIHPENIRWDSLDYDTQLELLQSLGKKRRQRFFGNRRIHGLIVKDTVTLSFGSKTKFLGHEFAPGKYEINTSDFLQPYVEYMGPEDVQNLRGIELHFRSNQPSGQLSNDAWTFLDALQINRTHQHIHIVAPLPVQKLKKNPEEQSILMSTFFANVNLVAEMITILEEGSSIRTNQNQSVVYFAPLAPHFLIEAAEYFQSEASDEPRKIADDLKMAWVGMRGSDKYDQPGLWGLEVRSISENSNSKIYKNFLNQIQYSMSTHSFHPNPEKILTWHRDMVSKGMDPFGVLATIWYNQSWENLIDNTPDYLLSFFPTQWAEKERMIRHLPRLGGDLYKMLIFNWLNHPSVYKNPELATRIKKSQIKALKKMMRSTALDYESHDIMMTFLIESGLFETALESIGLRLSSIEQES